ncbi:hypothetical protein HYH03_005467 [Edaphochlamys debaryana]|uniref:MAU2 chromatid cohesion factor homolog n=1 Tax=Edaphochlamys debaryana TaxID=47281 RepID=A0A836C2B5_9CHLO|nr:hypothetical protein HYH03_005467 [Edaphochlamys debaryana]|eukprot:KAG2496647.1 hypothetical protein HYH03_005467 [Edaphochlamys debaryana]
MLLQHTYNFKEALTHLLRAQLISNSLIGNYGLKYEVVDQLVTCYTYLGEEAQALQVLASLAKQWQYAQSNKSEWPVVCEWTCRLAHRAAVLHANAGRAEEAAHAAAEGLAFAEQHHLQSQRILLLLLSVQLAMARWEHAAVDRLFAALDAAMKGAGAAGAGGAAPQDPYLGLGQRGHLQALLHYNLLQVLFMLRRGKLNEVVKSTQEAPADPDAPDAPLPPVLHHLDSCLGQLEALGAQAGPAGAAAAALPYGLPGLASLEPLVCLVNALALRSAGQRPRRTEELLLKGISACQRLLASQCSLGPAASEDELPPQAAPAARGLLVLQALLTSARVQLLLSRGELAPARDELLSAQALLERFPVLLAHMGPGVHVLCGQYCLAAGEAAAAAAHFQVARLHSSNRPAQALAAVLEAGAHLSPHVAGGEASPSGAPVGPQAPEGVARALQALGPFYAVDSATGVPAPGPGALPGPLGYVEEAGCLLASACCLASQGRLPDANQLLSKALKLAHRKLGHTQLVCAVLSELGPIFLAEGNTQAAGEAVNSAAAFSQAAGDLWAEARAKRGQADTLRAQTMSDMAAAALASAGRREARIAAATAAARSDAGRHGYAVGWRLAAGA